MCLEPRFCAIRVPAIRPALFAPRVDVVAPTGRACGFYPGKEFDEDMAGEQGFQNFHSGAPLVVKKLVRIATLTNMVVCFWIFAIQNLLGKRRGILLK